MNFTLFIDFIDFIACRLPSTTSQEEVTSIVETLILDLGLTKCADTMIGGALIKGEIF